MISLKILIGAFAPILIFLSYTGLSPLASLAWTNAVAALFFLVLIIWHKSWKEFRNKLLWRYMVPIVSFAGVLFYVFYFWGISKTSVGNASLIGSLEILTSFLFFHFLIKEHFSKGHKLGMIFMFCGAAIVLFNDLSAPNLGDFLVLTAMIISPAGDYFQQEAKKIFSTETILFLRSFFTSLIVFGLAYFIDDNFSLALDGSSLVYMLVNGVLLFGLSRVFWIEAIHRMSVTKANALSAITPLFALFLAWPILKQVPTFWQLLAIVPLLIGTLLLTDNWKFNKTAV